MLKIPFNRPSTTGDEFEYLRRAIERGHISGDGFFTRRCHALLEKQLTVLQALLTTSCTHALEISALLLDFQPGDEVIVPSYAFVSTVNAFLLHGARPVFADVREDTLNLDESQLESLVTPRTRAIVALHYAGVGCEMGTIGEIARRRGFAIVEDNAHGLFGKYRGQHLGSFGALATQSFHETKNISCGEGGALLINDARYAERAEILREKGTNRKQFFRGQVDKYTWVDAGSSYLPSDLLAAYLLAQLEAREEIQSARRRAWEFYATHLTDWAAAQHIALPTVPAHCEQPYHLFYLMMPNEIERQRLIAHLAERGIGSVFHYQPLHNSAMGRRFGGQSGDCPVAERAGDCLLRLPLFNSLTTDDLERIVESVREFQCV